MAYKKKVLFVGESSTIATGFGTYWNEVISRLYASDEFSICELGSYVHDRHADLAKIPWRIHAVQPHPNDTEGRKIYRPTSTDQFGEWRFPQVCLDFQPDIVCGLRDYWMDEFVLRSPLRNKFKFIWMPTIDGIPQKELWLDAYKICDKVMTYSKWGYNVLKKDGRKETPLITVASPGVDTNVFKPVDNKQEHKQKLGIDPKSLIVGTIMRNQRRKLYYDLIQAFSQWVYKSKSKGHLELVQKTFLYLHTTYPDQGWDIAAAIKEFKVGNRVLMTYMCMEKTCQTVFPAFFSGELTICRKCGKNTAHPPHASSHVPRHVLADIINTFDLYVQYSICLHPDTPIMTSEGWNNIGNIVVGDEVVGKDGKLHRVYKTAKNKPDRCFDIKTKCRPWSITATDNHPWLIADQTGLSKGLVANIAAKVNPIERIVNRERYHKNHGTECPKLNFIYKRTDDLHPGDLLASRIPSEEILPEYDLPLPVDENMAYYLGLFVADGNANLSNGNNRITLHDTDHDNITRITYIAIEMGKKVCIRDCNSHGRHAKDIDINSVSFTAQLRNLLYNKDKTKQLPFGCHLWPKNLQEALIRGLMSGDGHYKNKSLNVYCTTSIHVAKMAGPILERLGWYYCCHIQYRDNKLPMYRFEIRTDGERRSHETLYRENFTLTKVSSSSLSDFDDDVISIDVEDDHNYNTTCGMTHNCEGFGMPVVEAMGCGVPIAAVRYSAMEDHLEAPCSIPIEVERFFRESVIETQQKRALPSNIDFVNKLDKFLKFSQSQRDEMTKKVRAYAVEKIDTYGTDQRMERYSWDRTAEIWRNIINGTEIHDRNTTWLNPKAQIKKFTTVPPRPNMNNVEFVRWLIADVWNKPEMAYTNFASEWIKALNRGFSIEGQNKIAFDRNKLTDHFVNLVKQENDVEQNRLAILNRDDPNKINMVTI